MDATAKPKNTSQTFKLFRQRKKVTIVTDSNNNSSTSESISHSESVVEPENAESQGTQSARGRYLNYMIFASSGYDKIMYLTNFTHGINNENFFSKNLLFILKNDVDERKVTLNIKIEINNHGINKVISVQLTDDVDLFFLYNLLLTEEDFQVLKAQQGLLVDFTLFPLKFVELLELCLQEQDKETPRFLLCLKINGSGELSEPSYCAELKIIETNPFKHLIHLSLKLTSGSDNEVKKHLATCLQKLKAKKLETEQRLQSTESNLTQKCKYQQEQLMSRAEEVEKLKTQLHYQTSELATKQNEQITTHKDMLTKMKDEYEQNIENLKQGMKVKYEKNIEDLERELSKCNCEKQVMLTDHEKLRQQTYDLNVQLSNLEPELQKYRIEVQNLRKDRMNLDSQHYELDKSVNQLKTKVAMLEQELKDKEQVIIKSQQLSEVSLEQKVHLEKLLEEKMVLISKRESSLTTLSEEIKKANEIISKLQNEIKSNHNKLKVRSQIATEQEKVLTQNDEILKILKDEKETLEKSLDVKEKECSKLKNDLMNAEKLLKTNENVITWLNKQLNEVQLGKAPRSISENIPPQIKVLTIMMSVAQPSTTSSKFQTPHAINSVIRAPFERSGQVARPPLGEKYFRKVPPLSQSTPNDGSPPFGSSSHQQIYSAAGGQAVNSKFPSLQHTKDNMLPSTVVGKKASPIYKPGSQAPLASSYFPTQKKPS
ncbi:Spindle assembly abnormal protein 6 [Nymphon striatum]|nr:Spindle assembly abnormal protein 6 [Nymphon striatum]